MKLPKIKLGKLLAKVAKAAAPLVVAAVAASVQAKVGRAADRVVARVRR